MDFSTNDLQAGSIFQLLDNPRIKNRVVPAMLENNRTHAAARAAQIMDEAAQQMQATLTAEADRLRDLQKINDHIREDEIAALESQARELITRITTAPIRLDAVRLIWQTPEN